MTNITIQKEVLESNLLKEDIKIVDMVENKPYYIKDDLGMCDKYMITLEDNEMTIKALWLKEGVYTTEGNHYLLIDNNMIKIAPTEEVLKDMKEDEERAFYMPNEAKVEDITLLKLYYYAT